MGAPVVHFEINGKDLRALPVTEMEMVTFGLFADPEGHVVGILKAEQPS